MHYFLNHSEENLELYYNQQGTPIVIKRTDYGVMQYTGERFILSRDFDKYNKTYYKMEAKNEKIHKFKFNINYHFWMLFLDK